MLRLAAANLLLYTGVYLCQAVVPLLARGMGAGTTLVGWVGTAFFLATLTMRLPAGMASDRFGRRGPLLAGALCAAGAAALLAAARTPGEIAAFRVLQGVGLALFTTALAPVVAAAAAPGRLTRTLSAFGISTNLAAAVGPFAGLQLLAGGRAGTGFALAAVACAGAAVLTAAPGAGVTDRGGTTLRAGRDEHESGGGAAAPGTSATASAAPASAAPGGSAAEPPPVATPASADHAPAASRAFSGRPVPEPVASAAVAHGAGGSPSATHLPPERRTGPPVERATAPALAWWPPAVAMVAFGVAYAVHVDFVPVLGAARGIPAFGLYYIAYALAVIATRSFSGRVGDRHGVAWLAVPGAVCGLAALALLGRAANLDGLVMAAILFGIAGGSIHPAALAALLAKAPAGRRGTASAIFYLSFDGGIALGGPAVGALLQRVPAATALPLVGLLGLAGAAAMALFSRRARVAAREGVQTAL